jgi:hypothetical protein
MSTELLKLAKGMGQAFKDAKDQLNSRSEVLQNGEYIARIQSCTRKKAKEKDTQYVEVDYYVMEGERKGHIEYSRLMLIPERLQSVIKFFDKFDFDTDALANDETGELIDSYCSAIDQASPLVKFTAQRWFRKDSDGALTDELGGVNIFLNSIIDSGTLTNEQAIVDNDNENELIEQEADQFEAMDKKELREYILANDNIDISMKFVASNDEDTIRSEIRKQIGSLADEDNSSVNADSEEEILQSKLFAICESQGVTEAEENHSLEELKKILDNKETGEQYHFTIEGEGALTEEEAETLVECGLDHLIVNEPEPEPEPEPLKKVIKKSVVPTGKKSLPQKGKLSLPAKKSGKK